MSINSKDFVSSTKQNGDLSLNLFEYVNFLPGGVLIKPKRVLCVGGGQKSIQWWVQCEQLPG